jgi:hypothetical protein
MNRYQVTFLDHIGRVSHDREIRCGSDEEAMDRAAAIRYRGGVEVWREGNLICHFQPALSSSYRRPTRLSARRTAAAV